MRARARRRALAHIRSGRARARAAQRRWRGGARGRRRGAQRAARHSDRRYRYRDHGVAGGGDPPRQGGRHQERADRHRARHRDAGGRRPAVRGHDACARTSRPSAARRRSRSAATGCATRSGAISPSTRCRSAPTASCTIMSAGLTTSPRGACASSAMPDAADRRGLFAHPAVLPHPRRLRRRRARSRGLSRLHRGRAGLATLSAERMRMEMLKLLVAEGAVRRGRRRWPMAGCCCRCSAASPISGRLRR